MSKRGVSYIKPQEPSFLTKLKQQAGYKEGPTVDTKREALPQLNDDDFVDNDEDQPTVVVLKPGDLTAEEAEQIKKLKEKESAPADLSERIVFRKPVKDKGVTGETNQSSNLEIKKRPSSESGSNKSSKKCKSSKEKPTPSSSKLLSFDAEDEEES